MKTNSLAGIVVISYLMFVMTGTGFSASGKSPNKSAPDTADSYDSTNTDASGKISSSKAIVAKPKAVSNAKVLKAQLAKNTNEKSQKDLIIKWIASDLESTKEWALENVKTDFLAKIWAENDLKAATEWALEIIEKDDGLSIKAISLGLAEKDPRKASEWAILLPEGRGRNEALSASVSKWVFVDHKSAMDWTMQLPDGDAKDAAIVSFVDKWAEKDPQSAAKWATSLCEKLPVKDKRGKGDFILKQVAKGWAEKDLQAATNWIDALPKEYRTEYIKLGLIQKLAEKDPKAAMKWLSDLPDSPLKQKAFVDFARGWEKKDKPAARKWAESIPDPKLKEFVLMNMLSSYDKKNHSKESKRTNSKD